MKVISLASRQCGSGKTLLAIHLAHAAAREGGHRVALIDTDYHGSLDHWRQKAALTGLRAAGSVEVFRLRPEALPDRLPQLAEQGYHVALVDTVWRPKWATEQVVAHSDVVVVPAAAQEADLVAATATATAVRAASRPALFVINRDEGNEALAEEARERLARLGPVAASRIPADDGLAESIVAGRTAIDVDPRSRASQSLRELWGEIIEAVDASVTAPGARIAAPRVGAGAVPILAAFDARTPAQAGEAGDASAVLEAPRPEPAPTREIVPEEPAQPDGGGHGRVLVVGNQKGGCGKSTLAMHLAVALMHQGLRIATVDLDASQRTFTHYLENRRQHLRRTAADLALPGSHVLGGETHSEPSFSDAVERLRQTHDVVVVDTPSGLTKLSRKAHSELDVLVTPVNDSFVDIDALARIDARTRAYLGDGTYGGLVRRALDRAAASGHPPPAWVVCRNRLSNLDAHNKRRVCEALADLAGHMNFTVAPGFSERVIYRELFLSGLTLLDLRRWHGSPDMSMSHVAARQELRGLLEMVFERLWPGEAPAVVLEPAGVLDSANASTG